MKSKLTLGRCIYAFGFGTLIWGVLSLHSAYRMVRWLALESQHHPDYLSNIQAMPESLDKYLVAIGIGAICMAVPDTFAWRKNDA